MIPINNHVRIGIEAETKVYMMSVVVDNGITLAETERKVTDGTGINRPLLIVETEGHDSGCGYMEFIFGPVVENELKNVGKVMKIVTELHSTLKVQPKTVGDWIRVFNSALLSHGTLRDYRLNPRNRTDLQIKAGRSAATLYQANVLLPITNFADSQKVRAMFGGFGREVEGQCDRMVDSIAQVSDLSSIEQGCLFIMAYFCLRYSFAYTLFSEHIEKQLFYLLPKIELVSAMNDILGANYGKKEIFINQLSRMGAELRKGVKQKFIRNVEIIEANLFSGNTLRQIAPRISATLPVYYSNEFGPCIVVEFRKGSLKILSEITSSWSYPIGLK